MTVVSGSPTLETIRDAIEQRTCVSVVGLPGSGRSTLLTLVGDAAEDDGWHVVRVSGHGASRPLDALVLGGLVTGTPGTPSALGAAVQSLTQATSSGPTLFLLDDADALDDTSAAVFASVLGQHDACVVASIRPPYPGTASVDRVLAGRQSTAMWLPALPIEEVHRMASQVLGGHVDADVAGRIYALSGGLAGIARAIMVEARRAGHLRAKGDRWVAVRDLWTPALAVVVHRLLAGLDEEDVDVLRILAVLGPAEEATARQVVPWSAVARLDDRGLLRFVDSQEQPLVVLFPPLLGDHLRQTGRGARGRDAVARISSVLNHGDPSISSRPPRPMLGAPLLWSSSPESAAILGRVLREHTTTRLLVYRDAWEREPTSRNTVNYLDALVSDGGHSELIETILASSWQASDEPEEYIAFVRCWEVSYRALVLDDPASAHTVLDRAVADDPDDAPLFAAVCQHVRLIGPLEHSVLPPWTALDQRDLDDEVERVPPPRGGIAIQVVDVIKTIRGELLLSEGHTVEAARALSSVRLPATTPRRDADAIETLAVLCAGDITGATERSARFLDEARVSLDRGQIEPHGYVVALGLHLQGKLARLREHLTTIFAASAPAPLRPSSRAGLLAIGATLSQLEGNLPSAQSMISQMTSHNLLCADLPIARPGPVAAAAEIAAGRPPRESTSAAWRTVAALVERGHILAAVFDSARLVDLWPDEQLVSVVADRAAAGQGPLLPALGRYLRATTQGSPDDLMQCADELHALQLNIHATRAHAAAIRHLRADRQSSRAAEEATRLRRILARTGEDLHLLVPSLVPAAALTARELEVARLVAAGLSNRDIAERLVVSDRTVDNHVYRIFRKLGVRSRDEIARVL